MKTCINRRNFLLNSVGVTLISVAPLKTLAIDSSSANAHKPFIKCGTMNQANLREFYHRANKNN